MDGHQSITAISFLSQSENSENSEVRNQSTRRVTSTFAKVSSFAFMYDPSIGGLQQLVGDSRVLKMRRKERLRIFLHFRCKIYIFFSIGKLY